MNRIPKLACCAIVLCLTAPVAAENDTPAIPVAPTLKAETLTGKERLGPKWTDEQRIDNCKVPPDKRGTRPRPILCADHLTN
jgi:hypothetical protein